MGLVPEKVEVIALACCTLHNFLRSKVESQSIYMPPGSIDTEDADTPFFVRENGTKDLHLLDCNHWHNRGATDTQTQLIKFVINYAQYFVSDKGSVPWQWNMV